MRSKRVLGNFITKMVRGEVRRLIDDAAAPAKSKVTGALEDLAREAAAPVQARVQRIVAATANRAAEHLIRAMTPEKKGGKAPGGGR